MSILLSIFIISFFVFYNSYSKKDYVNEKSYPTGASNYIIENLDYKNIRLFNQYDFGSYLLYREIPVFIDSRADLYLKEFNNCTVFADYISAKTEKNYKYVFSNYNFTHVLLDKSTVLGNRIVHNESYKVLYEDDNFILYELED